MTYASSYTAGDADSRRNEAEELLKMIREHEGGLTEKQRRFVTEMREAFSRYGPRTAVSGKQLLWLRSMIIIMLYIIESSISGT